MRFFRRRSILDEFELDPDDRLLALRCLGAYWMVRDTDFELIERLASGPVAALRAGNLPEMAPTALAAREEEVVRRELAHALLSCATPPSDLPPQAAHQILQVLHALSAPPDEYGVLYSDDPNEAVVQLATAFARIARIEGSPFSSLLLATSWREGFLGSAASVLRPIFSMARVEREVWERRGREFEGRLSAPQQESFRRCLSTVFVHGSK